MKCHLEPTDETRDGRRKHLCRRRCTGNDGKVREFWVPIGNRFAHPDECTGKIGPDEPAEIINAVAAGIGIPQAIQWVQQVAWRFVGSPINNIPPGIPAPLLLPPDKGPGTELKKILADLGITSQKCPGYCQEWVDRMNLWGAAGCREHSGEILDHLNEAYTEASLATKAEAGVKALAKGYPWTLAGLLDLAIERSATR